MAAKAKANSDSGTKRTLAMGFKARSGRCDSSTPSKTPQSSSTSGWVSESCWRRASLPRLLPTSLSECADLTAASSRLSSTFELAPTSTLITVSRPISSAGRTSYFRTPLSQHLLGRCGGKSGRASSVLRRCSICQRASAHHDGHFGQASSSNDGRFHRLADALASQESLHMVSVPNRSLVQRNQDVAERHTRAFGWRPWLDSHDHDSGIAPCLQ